MKRSFILKKQLTDKIMEMLPKQGRQSDAKQRKFLIQCIEDSGYIIKKPIFFGPEPKSEYYIESNSESEDEYYPQIQEDYELAGPSNYTPVQSNYQRTFLQNDDSRLSELQKRGITSEESEFAKVSEIIDTALSKLQHHKVNLDTVKIKDYALKLYKEILDYYTSGNIHQFKSNSQSIKRGYIALVLWYSLIQFQINISHEKLISYFNKTLVHDLFESEKYIKIIIPNLPKIKQDLTFLKDFVNTEIIDKIPKVIEHFDSSPKYTAAAVYYICSVPIHKGGIIPKKIKTITLDLLSKHFKITPSTISSGVQNIISFYSLHPELKDLV